VGGESGSGGSGDAEFEEEEGGGFAGALKDTVATGEVETS
jgi:hypothetical protein